MGRRYNIRFNNQRWILERRSKIRFHGPQSGVLNAVPKSTLGPERQVLEDSSKHSPWGPAPNTDFGTPFQNALYGPEGEFWNAVPKATLESQKRFLERRAKICLWGPKADFGRRSRIRFKALEAGFWTPFQHPPENPRSEFWNTDPISTA